MKMRLLLLLFSLLNFQVAVSFLEEKFAFRSCFVRRSQKLTEYRSKFSPNHPLKALPQLQSLSPVDFSQAVLTNVIVASAISQIPSQKLLTSEGLVHATMLGTGIWTTLGYKAWILTGIYFILGSLATKIKFSEKQRMAIAEKREGARGAENVWGSGATGLLCGLCGVLFPSWRQQFQLGFVASLVTKLSDTVASEIGKAYGKSTYLITTLKRVPRGTEGAVSMEGTAAGIVGSVVLTGIAHWLGLITGWRSSLTCVIAAFCATTVESIIGATIQSRYSLLTNEVVNFINTLTGAAIAIAATLLLK